MSIRESSRYDKAKELLGNRCLVVGYNHQQDARFDTETFQRLVEFAVELGATHINVGSLPFRYGTWVLPDNTDPYASWCNHNPSILRVCPPEELREWIPDKDVQIVQGMLRAQLDIMRPYGLKGVCHAAEPMWLPEGVYLAHPHWMGAQCELGRIASRPYFAPSIDEPEVLDLYRRAMKEFCTIFPEIDQFSFLANDSGSGIAWSPNLYPGMNGPARWRRRDGGERVANWLKAIQEGAVEAGGTMRLNVGGSGLPTELVTSVRTRLNPDLFIQERNGNGESFSVGGAGLSGGLWSVGYPVVGLGDPTGFIRGLQSVFQNPNQDGGRVGIFIPPTDMELARVLIESYLEEPGSGLRNCTNVALRAAERLTGSAELAESLISAWDMVRTAQQTIQQVRQKGFTLTMPFCCVSMRWLIRPLVPEPDKLTPEETAHYRNFMFAIEEQKDDPHFGMVLGKGVFRGESVMWMTRWCLQEAINTLHGARGTVKSLAKKTPDQSAAAWLNLYAARIGALACLCATVKNTVMYQYSLDIAGQPQYGPNMMDYDDNMICDMRALNQRKIAREEFDNIAELIKLIESQEGKVLEHASEPDGESVFTFGPNLVADLKRKMAIMLDHWHDYERLYPTTKVWDFEPEPTGNIFP